MPSQILRTIALAALGLSTLTSAHTWIEQMMVIAPNGTMIGQPGFARGNVLRSDPGFSDPTMVNLIPPNGRTINTILSTDLICKSTQTTQSQTNNSPRLQAAPGANIALRYQENGHVSLPQNQPGKPPNRGTVYVYGTTQPSPTDSLLAIHRVWNAAGTGGDGRGVLLSTQNFDDGQCYQINSGAISVARQAEFAHTATSLMGADLWCQQDIALPTSAPTGQPYTLYWVWDWPTMPGTAGFPDGKQEIYTTCMDVDVVANSGAGGSQSQVVANNFIAGQSLNSAAIPSELADIANPTAVVGQSIAFSGATGGGAAATATGGAISGTSTDFTITTNPGGSHSIVSVSTAAVVPVAASTTAPAFGGGNGGGGRGGGGGGSNSVAVSSIIPIPAATTPAAPATTAPATTSSSNGGNGGGGGGGGGGRHGGGDNGGGQAAGATFTEWESVTMTVFQTVFNKKRDAATQTILSSLPSPASSKAACTRSSSSSSSSSSTYTLRGRFYIPPPPAAAGQVEDGC